MSSYKDKLDKAKDIILEHNDNMSAALGDKAPLIDLEAFTQKLVLNGGTTDEMLQGCSWEDLIDCGLPKLLAKHVASVFRKSPKKEKTEPNVVTDKKAQRLTITELLAQYDPKDPMKISITKRLSELSRSPLGATDFPTSQSSNASRKPQPFIVFNLDGSVNTKISMQLLEDILAGHQAMEIQTVGGRPSKVYLAGELPDVVFQENPLYPGRILRGSAAVCDQTNRSWESVPQTIRAMLWLAVKETGELKILQLTDAHNALDWALRDDSESVIRARFPRASLRLGELEVAGNAPSLKISRTSSKRKQDPFHRTY